MKRIICTCFLLTAIAAASFAQNLQQATATQTEQTDHKMVFNSAISKFEAYTSRENKEAAQKAVNEALESMANIISANTVRMEDMKGEDKEAFGITVKRQNSLRTEVKTLSPEPLKNSKVILEKLKAFKETL